MRNDTEKQSEHRSRWVKIKGPAAVTSVPGDGRHERVPQRHRRKMDNFRRLQLMKVVCVVDGRSLPANDEFPRSAMSKQIAARNPNQLPYSRWLARLAFGIPHVIVPLGGVKRARTQSPLLREMFHARTKRRVGKQTAETYPIWQAATTGQPAAEHSGGIR